VGTVVLTLTASGSVSDFLDNDKSRLQQKIADTAGVDKSLVTIRVAAASVRITATIIVPVSTTAGVVQTSLSSRLSTAEAASTALGITVEELPTITVALAQQPPTSPLGSDDSQPSCGGGCIVGVVVGCSVLVLMCTGWLSGAFAKSGCPSPFNKPKRLLDQNRGLSRVYSADQFTVQNI
tara:strand:- start:2638 stop:3177 length:540 start_codon:yes stop_codon:yes gene_type:complete